MLAAQEKGKAETLAARPGVFLAIAILIFALAAAALLHKSLLPGYTLVPLEIIQDIAPWDHLALGPRANRLLIDPFFVFYPNRFLQTAALRSGTLPLWNPYILTGTPVFADPNFQPFYPPNLLAALVLPVHQALPWLAFFHLTLTGIFLYLFLRRHRLHWLACVLGGGVWLLNGYLLVWLENPHRLSTATWLPGVFWAYEVATQEGKMAWAALGGLFLGMAILGGQVQFVFIMGVMLGLYALVKLVLDAREGRWSPRPGLTLALIGVIGLGIGALLLLPANQFAALSHRSLEASGGVESTSWPLAHLVTLIAPDFYGNPATPVHYWGAVNYAEVTVYFGVVALLLALTAAFVARRNRFLVQAGMLAVATLAITLGTPLARLLQFLPGGDFIALNRTIILIPFAGAWLAPAGLDGWLRAEASRRRQMVALGVALAVLVTIVLGVIVSLGDAFAPHRADALADVGRGALLVGGALVLLLLIRRWPRPAGVLLVALALFDLWQWGHDFNPITSIDYLYPDNAVVERLRQDDGRYRVLPLQDGKIVFGPNILPLFGMEDLTAYSSLIKSDYYRLIEAMDPNVTIDWMAANPNILVMSHFHPLTGLLNVRYVLAAHELPASGLQPLGVYDGVWVYENPDVMPRAFLVRHVLSRPEDEILPTLLSPEFNWRQSALVSVPLAASSPLAEAPEPAGGTATITDYGPHRVDVTVETDAAAFLVLSDAYYPGWEATLDGEPVRVHKTNGVMRGVFVPAGRHHVRFRFRPVVLQTGLFLAAIATLAAATIIMHANWRRLNPARDG